MTGYIRECVLSGGLVLACWAVSAGEPVDLEAVTGRAAAIHRELARPYLEQARWDDAIGEYERLVRLAPDDAQSHYLLGYSYSGKAYQDGDRQLLDTAIAAYRRALQIDPTLAEALNELGTAYRMVGKYGDAIEALSKARALRPDWEVPRFNLADAYRAKGLWEPALAEYRWILQHPGSFSASLYRVYNGIGQLHESAGKLTEAVAALTTAVALNPSFFHARVNLARVYVQQFRLDEAIAEYVEAIRLEPQNPELDYTVSQLHALRKRYELALESLERAVEKGFNDRDAIGRNPLFRRLRTDSRFLKLIGGDR